MTESRLTYLLCSIEENDDQFALNELFRYFFPGLLSFANSITRDESKSEELIADTFYKIWENRKLLTSIKNFSHYLYVATKNNCINYLSSKEFSNKKRLVLMDNVGDDLPGSFNSAESKLSRAETIAYITAILNNLPPKCRLIFRLIKEEGMKYSEVASLLGLSEKTVESQMRIAFRKIAEILRSAQIESGVSFKK